MSFPKKPEDCPHPPNRWEKIGGVWVCMDCGQRGDEEDAKTR